MKDYEAFYQSPEWRRARYDALKAGDGKCCLCGRGRKDGVTLNVDHIVPLRKDWEQRLKQANLQVLCHECNHGKGNRDTTDWRRTKPRIRLTNSEKRKRRAKRGKRHGKKEKYIPGTFGQASETRVVSIDAWIEEQIAKRSAK